MNLFVYRKLNIVINVLIVVVCILMLIFLNLNFIKKIIVVTILILKLLSILDYFKKYKNDDKQEVKKCNKNKKRAK